MECETLRSSNEETEIGDGHLFLLELSESDPNSEEKKKLMKNKGFDHKETIYFKNSSSPDSINVAFRKLLQRARIIQLDETELYFVGADGTMQVDFYSHRNELEALNLILSILSATPIEINVLKHLRKITIDKISELGDKCKVESKIIDNCIYDKEKTLLQWGESNGVRTKLQIAYIEGAGRGGVAVQDLKVGEIALEVPVSIIISEQLVHESDMFHILNELDGISSETMMLLWSMREKHDNSSKFKLYFDSLPAEFKTGLSFGIEAILALEGTLLLEELMQAKEHLRAEYDKLFPSICNDYPDIFPPEYYNWEEFLWACELWYSNSMRVLFPDGKLRTCLVPIASFLNHSVLPHITHYSQIDGATNSLKFPLARPCNVGKECFLSYGKLSSFHLVTFYGFLPQGDNPYDVIPVDIDVPQAVCSEEDCQMANNTTRHMVRGTWLSRNHEIFYYGLPPPLLDHLRMARRSSSLHNWTLGSENLEIEKEVLQDLSSTFEVMLESLDDTEELRESSKNWDVKLAMECKILQMNIVSSITTACHSGLELLQTNLN